MPTETNFYIAISITKVLVIVEQFAGNKFERNKKKESFFFQITSS